MAESIQLHPKYGVNPTMPVCFWCQKETGEIALLGAAYKGEAPSRMCVSYEPCQKCVASFGAGIHMFELDDKPPHHPTGRYVVAARESLPLFIKDAGMIAGILKRGRAAVPAKVMNFLLSAAEDETKRRSTVEGPETPQ